MPSFKKKTKQTNQYLTVNERADRTYGPALKQDMVAEQDKHLPH